MRFHKSQAADSLSDWANRGNPFLPANDEDQPVCLDENDEPIPVGDPERRRRTRHIVAAQRETRACRKPCCEQSEDPR